MTPGPWSLSVCNRKDASASFLDALNRCRQGTVGSDRCLHGTATHAHWVRSGPGDGVTLAVSISRSWDLAASKECSAGANAAQKHGLMASVKSGEAVAKAADAANAFLQGTAAAQLDTQGWTTHHWNHFLRSFKGTPQHHKKIVVIAGELRF